MIGAGVVVGAPVIDVLADAASLQLAADAFPGDRLAAVRAVEQATSQWMTGRSGSPVPAVQDVLPGVERGSVDESPVAPLEDLPVPVQFADVEAVAEDVRERRAMEAGLSPTENVPLAGKLVGEALEGVAARGVELEDADQRPRFLRVGLDRLVTVVHVDVAKRRQPRGPPLPDFLVHALEHFGPQVIAVV